MVSIPFFIFILQIIHKKFFFTCVNHPKVLLAHEKKKVTQVKKGNNTLSKEIQLPNSCYSANLHSVG